MSFNPHHVNMKQFKTIQDTRNGRTPLHNMMVGNQQSISMSSPPSRKSNKRKHSHKHTSRFISGQSNVGHSVRGADENHESVTLTRPIQPRIETFFRAFSSNKDETTLSKTTTERTKNISNLHHPIVKPSKSHATKQSSRFFPYLHYKSRLEKDPLLFTGEGQSINEPNMLLSFHSRAFASGLAAIHNMTPLRVRMSAMEMTSHSM